MAQLRLDYQCAFDGVVKKELSEAAFLAAFEPSSTDVHREILLRFRKDLVSLAGRGFEEAFNDYYTGAKVSRELAAVDPAARKATALATAQRSAHEPLETLSDLQPSDIFAKARMDAKLEEIARLEAEVAAAEKEVDADRERLQEETNTFAAKSNSVKAFIDSNIGAAQTLSSLAK